MENTILINAICPGGIQGHVKGRNKARQKIY